MLEMSDDNNSYIHIHIMEASRGTMPLSAKRDHAIHGIHECCRVSWVVLRHVSRVVTYVKWTSICARIQDTSPWQGEDALDFVCRLLAIRLVSWVVCNRVRIQDTSPWQGANAHDFFRERTPPGIRLVSWVVCSCARIQDIVLWPGANAHDLFRDHSSPAIRLVSWVVCSTVCVPRI
jgi:hypothetical protein